MANTVETKFHDEVIKLLDDNKSTNHIIFTRERYLTKKYDVLEIAGIEKFVRKWTDVIYYCTTEELYRLIKTVHPGIGQGHIHCSCRSGCKTGKCKCKRKNILCNFICHASLSCANE